MRSARALVCDVSSNARAFCVYDVYLTHFNVQLIVNYFGDLTWHTSFGYLLLVLRIARHREVSAMKKQGVINKQES
jgi:hypothetical protein